MTNRVRDAIEKLRGNPGLESVPDSALTIGFREHATYQGIQSSAFASNRITLEEAGLIYHALGEVFTEENNGWEHHADRATKVIVIRIISELAGVA